MAAIFSAADGRNRVALLLSVLVTGLPAMLSTGCFQFPAPDEAAQSPTAEAKGEPVAPPSSPSGGSTASTAVTPAAPSAKVPETSLPATPAAAAPSSTTSQPPAIPPPAASKPSTLAYAWKAGAGYECDYRIELTIGDAKEVMSGSTVFTPIESQWSKALAPPAEAKGSGSAFVVHPDGILATCAHVVRRASSITVRMGERDYPATVLASNVQHDIALLRIEAKGLPTLPLQSAKGVELGQEIRILGFPLSDMLGQSVKVTRGTVSGVVRKDESNLFQVDAAINPGNSGGPMVDNQGRVVGMARSILVGDDLQGLGFVTPADEIVKLLKEKQLQAASLPTGEELKGTELVKRVAPAVALVNVVIGGGGASDRRIVDYLTVETRHAQSSRSPINPLPPKTAQGTIFVDQLGDATFRGGLDPPFLFGGIGRIGLESLPGDDRKSWSGKRLTAIVSEAESPASRGGPLGPPRPSGPPSRYPLPRPSYPGGFRPPYTRPPFDDRTPTTKTRIVLPVIEQIQYRLESEDEQTVTIAKEYEMTPLAEDEAKAQLKVTGKGTITWDKTLGFPKKGTLSGEMTIADKALTLRVPYTLSYEGKQRENKPPVVKTPATPPPATPTPPTPAVPTPIATDLPPTPRVPAGEPDPSAAERSIKRLPTSTGLDKYRPDE